jgi:hypothetical protein
MCSLLWTDAAHASGHGPVFGGATPTLGKGGWSFDQAWMGSRARSGDDDQLLRSMVGLGVTKDLQVTVSLPVELASSGRIPSGRMTFTMSGVRDVEALAGWRFHRRDIGEGARFESTLYGGIAVPLDATRGGIRTAPSAYASVASGYASRAHYFWMGASYQRSMDDQGDRQGDVASASIVYGYRPAVLRLDYPKPDLRFFVETMAEVTGSSRKGDVAVPDAGGRAVFTGPTALLLYKEYGVSGGVLFPVYQHPNGSQPRERYRFGINVSYFFWLK